MAEILKYHTDSAHRMIIYAFSDLPCEWDGLRPRKWDAFFTERLDDPKLAYDEIHYLRNCNVMPHATRQYIMMLPVWHAAVVCTNQGRPTRAMFVNEVSTLDSLITYYAPSTIPNCIAPGFQQYLQNVTIRDTNLSEDPIDLLDDALIELFDGKEVVVTDGWIDAESRQAVQEATRDLRNEPVGHKWSPMICYELQTEEMYIFFHFQAGFCLPTEDGNAKFFLVQRDECTKAY